MEQLQKEACKTFRGQIVAKSIEFDNAYYIADPVAINPDEEKKKSEEKITEPIILWWTPFTGERGRYKKCGNVNCFFTVDRHYMNNPQTKVSQITAPIIYYN